MSAAKKTPPRQFPSFSGKIFAITASDMNPILIVRVNPPKSIEEGDFYCRR
jgi:hypothetical protein